jgi:hypothetical protein
VNGRSFNYWAIAVAAASWGTWSVFLRFAEAEHPLADCWEPLALLQPQGEEQISTSTSSPNETPYDAMGILTNAVLVRRRY